MVGICGSAEGRHGSMRIQVIATLDVREGLFNQSVYFRLSEFRIA